MKSPDYSHQLIHGGQERWLADSKALIYVSDLLINLDTL